MKKVNPICRPDFLPSKLLHVGNEELETYFPQTRNIFFIGKLHHRKRWEIEKGTQPRQTPL